MSVIRNIFLLLTCGETITRPAEDSFECRDESVIRDSAYRPAALALLAGILVGFRIAAYGASRFSDWPDWMRLLISFLPYQIAGFGAALSACAITLRGSGVRRMLDIPCTPGAGHFRHIPRLLCLAWSGVILLNLAVWLVCHLADIPAEQQHIVELMRHKHAFPFWLTLFIGTVVIAPVTEEFMLRVVTFRALRSVSSTAWAVVLTSLLFALSHGAPRYIPALAFLGVMLQTARRHGGLPAAILLHSLYNLSSFLLILLTRRPA